MSIYSGVKIEENSREWKKQEITKEIKVEKLGERSFLVVENGRKFVKKCFKGFNEEVLDDVFNGIANWLHLRGVDRVQRLVRLDVDEMCVYAEYVEGVNLREYVAKHGGRLGEEKATCVCLEIATVLKKALDKGVIHRDLKPENVIITQDRKITVIDWEFSVRLDAKPRVPIGTLNYIPPEGRDVSELKMPGKYDVFRLGAMLNEMITGKPYRTLTSRNKILVELVSKTSS